jgi:hypothetical protein
MERLGSFSYITLLMAITALIAGIIGMFTAWTIDSDRLEKIAMRLLLAGGILLLVSFTLCSYGVHKYI